MRLLEQKFASPEAKKEQFSGSTRSGLTKLSHDPFITAKDTPNASTTSARANFVEQGQRQNTFKTSEDSSAFFKLSQQMAGSDKAHDQQVVRKEAGMPPNEFPNELPNPRFRKFPKPEAAAQGQGSMSVEPPAPEYWESYLATTPTVSTSSSSLSSSPQSNTSSPPKPQSPTNLKQPSQNPDSPASVMLQGLLEDSIDEPYFGDEASEEEERTTPPSKSQQELYYQFSPTAQDAIHEVPAVHARSQAATSSIIETDSRPEPPHGPVHEEASTTRTELPMGATDVVAKSLETTGLEHSSPVLLRMPNTAFGISMGLAGNAIMWKAAGDADFVTDLMNPASANMVLWFASFIVAVMTVFTYLYKIIFNFEMVVMEFKHPVRIHFFNAPNLTLLMLSIGIPKAIEASSVCLQILFVVGLSFQFGITQCVYEKWMFSSERNISQAKPQFFLSVIGWFLLTILGQQADIAAVWGIAIPSFCFGIGFFMYVMVTVNVFNGLHRNINNKGSPALTLLMAPPSVAAIALDGLDGDTSEFNIVAQAVLGWAILLCLLLLRLGPRIAENPTEVGTYWAYVFPLAALSSACLKYAVVSETMATEILAIMVMALATIALCTVFLRMSYHIWLCLQNKARWGDPLLGIESGITSKHEPESSGEASSHPEEEQSMA
jgi:tellurite resistance protein